MYKNMEEENEVDLDTSDVGYHLTLFSDIKQNFKDIKETVPHKVSEALENDFVAKITSASKTILCESQDDWDDVPLSIRCQQVTEKNDNEVERRPWTRSRQCRKRKSVESQDSGPHDTVISSAAVITDVEVLSDLSNDIEYVGSVSNDNIDTSLDIIIEEKEDENRLVPVKVNWKDLQTYRFEIRKHQKFATIFDELAEKENVRKDRILLILRDKIIIKSDDTPDSLNLSIIDIIEGGITNEIPSNDCRSLQEVDNDMLEFKCMLKDKKKPLLIHIKKTDTMYCLMVKTAEQLECPLDKIKFMFEGDPLDSDDTPTGLDLEGGEIIDILLKQ